MTVKRGKNKSVKKQTAQPESGRTPRPVTDQNDRGKRRWKRYALQNGAVVMIYRPSLFKLGKPARVKLGPIKDIGMRGLAVQYIDRKNILRDVEELAIALADGSVVVDKIKFRVVMDFEVADLPKTGAIHTLCVHFTNLVPAQKVRLERFIDENASEIVADCTPN